MAGTIAMTSAQVERTITRMAHELAERLGDPDQYALVGILSGGEWLAQRLAVTLARTEGRAPRLGTLDITLYRDDLYTGLEKPVLGETRIPFELTGAGIVLVDDVLFTGRTVRAAMDELMDYGRPSFIKLAVLIDRGHRELPIAADVVGRVIATEKHDKVVVRLVEDGSKQDEVEIRWSHKGDEGR